MATTDNVNSHTQMMLEHLLRDLQPKLEAQKKLVHAAEIAENQAGAYCTQTKTAKVDAAEKLKRALEEKRGRDEEAQKAATKLRPVQDAFMRAKNVFKERRAEFEAATASAKQAASRKRDADAAFGRAQVVNDNAICEYEKAKKRMVEATEDVAEKTGQQEAIKVVMARLRGQ